MKTDKELAVELTMAYVQSWNAKENTQPIKADLLIDIYKAVYEAISASGQNHS